MKLFYFGLFLIFLGCFAIEYETRAHSTNPSSYADEVSTPPNPFSSTGPEPEQREVCDPRLSQFMKLKFFAETPEKERCTTVKRVEKAADDLATELNISPIEKMREPALSFVGEKGLPPSEPEKQEEYFEDLYRKVSPFFPNNPDKTSTTTKERFKDLVLERVRREQEKPLSPSSPSSEPTLDPKPTSDSVTEVPSIKPGTSPSPLAPEPQQPGPAVTTHPSPVILPQPDPALSSAPSPTPFSSPSSSRPLSVAKNQTPNSPPSPSTLDSAPTNALSASAPRRLDVSKIPLAKIVVQEKATPAVIPSPVMPAAGSTRSPLEEASSGTTRGTTASHPEKEYLDLVLNALKPQLDPKKPDLSVDKKMETEKKGIAVSPEKQKDPKEPLVVKNLVPSSPSPVIVPQSSQATPLPSFLEKGSATNDNSPSVQKKTPSAVVSAKQAPSSLNTALKNFSLPPASGGSIQAVGTTQVEPVSIGSPKKVKEKAPTKLSEASEAQENSIFSKFVDFARKKKAQSESPLRNLSSEQPFYDGPHLDNTKGELTGLTTPSNLNGPSFSSWLAFFVGSGGTLCFLLGMALHLRNKRSKSTALALPRKLKNLN